MADTSSVETDRSLCTRFNGLNLNIHRVYLNRLPQKNKLGKYLNLCVAKKPKHHIDQFVNALPLKRKRNGEPDYRITKKQRLEFETFIYFTRLPAEIQKRIWEFAVPRDRLVYTWSDTHERHRERMHSINLSSMTKQWIKTAPCYWTALATTCYEARSALTAMGLKKEWELGFSAVTSQFINPWGDIFFFGPTTRLRMARLNVSSVERVAVLSASFSSPRRCRAVLESFSRLMPKIREIIVLFHPDYIGPYTPVPTLERLFLGPLGPLQDVGYSIANNQGGTDVWNSKWMDLKPTILEAWDSYSKRTDRPNCRVPKLSGARLEYHSYFYDTTPDRRRITDGK